MAGPGLPLKPYQTATLNAVRDWLTEAAATQDAGAAFYKITRRAYQDVNDLPDVPYACLRVPTGGGKTLIAAHMVGVAADAFLKTDMPVALWLVPSNPIREQTLKALTDRAHPYRAALAERFGENVRVMTVGEALYAKRPDYDGGAAIIVATLQSFRVAETEGRKVYEPNGELMDHFTGVSEALLQGLEQGPDGGPIRSLCNVLRLRRPIVIVDEAHNARTALSFATLARINPALILELSATPAKDSNILHQVSAAELKADEMIKLPIVLRGRPDWKETVADAKRWLEQLEAIAAAEETLTGEYIRPVMLMQAQPNRKGTAAITPDVLKVALIDDFHVPPSQIAIATGTQWELDDHDLAARDCPIRFVITVQALREGWDCPGAYVLCTIAEQRGERAVEQLLGRVLRLPKARRKRHDDLNRAYAFAATQSFADTARSLVEGLVANGFERIDAKELIRPPRTLPGMQDDPAIWQSSPIADGIDLEAMRAKVLSATGGRVRLNVEARRFETSHRVSVADATTLRLVVAAEAADALEELIAATAHPDEAPVSASMRIPLLCVRRNGQLEIFDRGHFLDHPWRLDDCDARAVAMAFVPPEGTAQEAHIDVQASGRIAPVFVQDVHEQLALALDDRDWTLPQLVGWLTRRLAPVTRGDVLPKSAQAFVRAGIAALEAKGHSVARLARLRFRLVDTFTRVINDYRADRETQSFEACLFGSSLRFETASDHVAVFEAESYWPDARQLYSGRFSFPKHIRPDRIGEMNGDEEQCALVLEQSPKVQRWARILDRMPGTFRIARSSGWFYPDFIAELTDGRFLAIEYKGAQLAESRETEEKEMVGRKWAEASAGKCLFVMAKDRDFQAITRAIN